MYQVVRQFFLFIFLTGSSITISYAQEPDNVFNRCNNKAQKNKVNVHTVWRDFTIDNAIPSSKLNFRASHSPTGDFVVGLTSLITVTEIDFNGDLVKDKSGEGECLAPNIKITIALDPIQVYIGSEFKPDTCAYNKIFEHEMKHVALYKNNLPKVATIVHDLLKRRLGEHPIYAPKGAAYRVLKHEIDQFWRPLIKTELSKVEIDQQAIDSDEEGMELALACNGTIQKRFGMRSGTDALDIF